MSGADVVRYVLFHLYLPMTCVIVDKSHKNRNILHGSSFFHLVLGSTPSFLNPVGHQAANCPNPGPTW